MVQNSWIFAHMFGEYVSSKCDLMTIFIQIPLFLEQDLHTLSKKESTSVRVV